VFIGPGRFQTRQPRFLSLKSERVRCGVFLLWLKGAYRLYIDMTLDPDIMDLYPDHGILPGLGHNVLKIMTLTFAQYLQRKQQVLQNTLRKALTGSSCDFRCPSYFVGKNGCF